MFRSSNRLSRFWHELKRRKTIHVATVYASVSFVIIELVNNLTGPLNLPSRLSTIVIIILAVGFPLAMILSWLYDLSSEGVQKTKPLSEVPENNQWSVPNAWKIATYVSFIVIAGLVVLHISGRIAKSDSGPIQSLVILPFDNFTGDDELDYFVSGMHSSLISDMGKISGLRIISKTSANAYKDVDMKATDIASELNVEGVVETDVLCLGDTICIQFRLVSTSGDEDPIWIADYKEEKSQILNLYNRVTKQIADEVRIELTENEEKMLTTMRTVDKDAYDAFLRGHQYWDDLREESLKKTLEYLNRAIEKDPEWAPPYAGLAKVLVGMTTLGFESPEIAGPKIIEYLNKALELDPDLHDSHFTKAIVAVWNEWDWETGEREFIKALAINPNDVMSRTYYAHLLSILQRNDEALAQGQLAVDLDPLNPLIHGMFAGTLICAGEVETSLQHLEKALAIDSENYFAYSVLEMVAIQSEEYGKVIEALKYILPLQQEVYQDYEGIKDENEFIKAYKDIVHQLEALSDNNFVLPFDMAIRYHRIKQYDKALIWLEKAYEIHDATLPYLATGYGNFVELHRNPRFIALVEKMNLPLPAK